MRGITELGFVEPTPVQLHVIPEALKGNDIRACAQTGTGKTCAFVIPILDRLVKHPPTHRPTVLVVLPTRELGAQVEKVVQDVGKFTKIKSALIHGGVSFQYQVRKIRAGAQIVVATPGRLLDHLRQGVFSLKHVNTLVLDEADRMLDMGFLPDIRRILSQCPEKKHTMFFSATFPPEIEAMLKTLLTNPVVVELTASAPSENVTQMVYPISKSQKEALLQAILEIGNISSALVFCRTKHGADHLAHVLTKLGKSVTVIHSDKSQLERDRALDGFRNRRFQLCVATDIAARGIDIKDISHVINFDVPQHPEDYVHRIGRTGRAQAMGDAMTLMAPDEEIYIRRIEKFTARTIPRSVIPDFPYLVPPKLVSQQKSVADMFGRQRRRIPTSSRNRFR